MQERVSLANIQEGIRPNAYLLSARIVRFRSGSISKQSDVSHATEQLIDKQTHLLCIIVDLATDLIAPFPRLFVSDLSPDLALGLQAVFPGRLVTCSRDRGLSVY